MKELVVNNYPKSSVTESIRTIKANLRFSSVNKKITKILITSSTEGEGKSFISANLAATFASPTEKVLLIDCDLRRGRQHKLFDIENKLNLGLSNLLIDENWKKNLKKYLNATNIENLDVLTTGTTPPNPTTLLESVKLEEIINELEKSYDMILLDTPPVTGLSDTLILTRLVDTSLIVASANKTPKDILNNTIESLNNTKTPIAGVILNRVKKSKSKYYSNYHIDK